MDARLKLKEYCKENNTFPTRLEWDVYAKANNLPSSNNIMFSSKKRWNEIRNELGYEHKSLINFREEREKKKEIAIQHLNFAKEKLGDYFSRKEYNKLAIENNLLTSQQLSTLFGSFNDAKKEIGLAVRLMKNKWSDKDLIDSVMECSNFYGKELFSEKQYEEWRNKQKDVRPTIDTIRKRLGLVSDLKEKIGIEYNMPTMNLKHMSREECIGIIMEFAISQLSSRKYKEWSEKNKYPTIEFLRYNSDLGWEEMKKEVVKILFDLKNK